MSVRVMAQVWDAELPPNHKLVLLAYADAANDDGTHSYPGEERVAQMTGYSVSQVRRVTRELIESGRLIRVKRGYRGQRAEYSIPNLKGAQSATHSGGESLANGHRKPSADASPPVLTRPNTSPNGEVRAELFEAFYEFWTGNPYQPGSTIPKIQRQRINSAVGQALEAGITADEVRERGSRYRKEWKDLEATPQALLLHWHRFDGSKVVEWSPEDCRHIAAADRDGDGRLWCPACERYLVGVET